MTARKRSRPSSRNPATASGVRRVPALTVALVLAVGIVATVVLLRGRQPGGMGVPLPCSKQALQQRFDVVFVRMP